MTHPTPPPPPPPIDKVVKGECVNCGLKDRWLLHRVLLRGADRRVCTSCVLRLHPSSFCPSCFEFFDHPLSATSSAAAHRFISCVKCSSLTHIRCLPSPPPLPSSFICPPCSKPNFTFFPVPESPIDKNLAQVLLCASKIASASMARTFVIASARADRAVREAAAARKRVKEALDHYSEVQKLRRVDTSLEVSGPRNLEVDRKVVYKNVELKAFNGGQGKVKVPPSEVLPLPQHQNRLPVPVNRNGANVNPVKVKEEFTVNNNGANVVNHVIVKEELVSDGTLGNHEQDLESVQSCHGGNGIVDVTSATGTLNIK